MPWYLNLLIVVVACALVALLFARLHKHLLKLWKDVTTKEVIFHKQLEKVATLFHENKELLKTEDNKEFFKIITRYRKKHVRTLLLSTRQALFNAINIIFDEIEELEEAEFALLKKEFNELQKVRRIYNTNVLIYNQTISVFPTRYLALRMNLELREYFG
ncbi:hypothetical protein KQ51_00875 [Candidatus Izimaplasma bacterium HR1]|jgi:hypothetical protein|uniref:hypothetical protein n=1 Tax=Candidatus Izimoplasma sp. HR1 TaxID=1541959 RepID=UPI0004F6047A|nr:hypothetical protein KQ51_00875 [Candidatus Izimaplasma bacterium HR1]